MSNTQRSQWDIGRFVQTLSYFEVIPALNWIQNLITGKSGDNIKKPDGAKQVGVILVIGATSDLGKYVVQELVSQGYPTRCVVENIATARDILGQEPELVVANTSDITSFTPLVLNNTRAIIYCGEKNLPSQQLENLLNIAQQSLPTPGCLTLFDFTNPSIELKQVWGAVDDVVMGGVSQSNLQITPEGGLFAGYVSTANSGGFASVRSRNFSPPFDLSNYAGIQLRVKGDGQRYKFLLRSQTQWDGMAYSYSFDTVADTWIDVKIPFSGFTPVFRAKTVTNAPPLSTHEICSLQLMLSKFEYDGQLNPNFTPGGFALHVESISAYGGLHFPQFILVTEPLTTAPVNIIRNSHIPYTLIYPGFLTNDRGGKEIILTQNHQLNIPSSNGEIQELSQKTISRADLALVCVHALHTSQAHNRTITVYTTDNPAREVNWQEMFVHLIKDRE